MLEVSLLYATLQIHAELIQTYKDANVGAKVTKFLTCTQSLINLVITITKIMNGHLTKHGKKGMNLPHKMRVSLQRQGLH